MAKERLECFGTHKPLIREVQREDGTTVREFEGYAIVFNEPSVCMCDWWDGQVFREYIEPDAISQEMLDKNDIVCTAFHNREKLLARHHADGTGSMTLEKDDKGVKCRFEFDPTNPLHNEIASAVERGDMPGMSFSFYESDYTYTDTKGADGIIDRHITQIASIFEVTVASNPAYPATTAACREEWERLTPSEEELLKRQKEEKEARHHLAMREIEVAQAQRAQAVREYDL